jgi:DNA-binding PadR family transcriptional regulator
MYADNTLTPKEAVRLCALGILADGAMRYGALATEVRHFVGHMIGPSLDVLAPSIELLKYEGLVTPLDGKGMEDDASLKITAAGKAEMHALLTANIRAGATELNKLIIALKFRFLHLLEKPKQADQADLLIDVYENALARLDNLRQYHADDDGYLVSWLDHDIETVEARIAWLRSFRAHLGA